MQSINDYCAPNPKLIFYIIIPTLTRGSERTLEEFMKVMLRTG